MSASWDSLYLPSADQAAVADHLRASLTNLGYRLYDAFGRLPGRSYAQTTRLFVSPAQSGWVRVIGTPDPHLLTSLSAHGLCLYVRLDGTDAHIETFTRGNTRPIAGALAPYLRPDCSIENLQQVLSGEFAPQPDAAAPVMPTPLPADVQALAASVDPQQAQKMFERLSGGLMKKVGQRTGTDADALSAAAQDLVQGSAPDWNSPGGQRIRAVMQCLTIPADWREPDFTTLREAYALHARRRRKPDARLYPGDADALAAVPHALDYLPVYGGRDT
jgi:hypothetical protein